MAAEKFDLQEPPVNELRFTLRGSYWDSECALAALLHYIESKKLSKDAMKWIKKNFPENHKYVTRI